LRNRAGTPVLFYSAGKPEIIFGLMSIIVKILSQKMAEISLFLFEIPYIDIATWKTEPPPDFRIYRET